MTRKLIDTDIKLGKGTLLREAVYDVLDKPDFQITIRTISGTTDGSGFVYVGYFPDRNVNVFGFIQSFDGKTNLELRYYHLIPVRNGNSIFFKVEATNNVAVNSKSIQFIYTAIIPT